jgi:hypothetical protein
MTRSKNSRFGKIKKRFYKKKSQPQQQQQQQNPTTTRKQQPPKIHQETTGSLEIPSNNRPGRCTKQ